MSDPAGGTAAQRRNTRLLGAGLMLMSVMVGVLTIDDIVSLRGDMAAGRSPVILYHAPAVMIPCVLAMGWIALSMLWLPGRRGQRRLFGAALASMALLLVLPFVLPRMAERALESRGYSACDHGDSASRLPSSVWVQGSVEACSRAIG